MAAESGGDVLDQNAEDEVPQTFWNQFAQQRLKAWQPIFSPTWVISIYIACGVLFSGLGLVLLFTSWGVVEYVYDYTDHRASEATGVGWFDIDVEKDMEPPIWLYYQLEGFHQNHRRYIKSRDDQQMQLSTPIIDASKLIKCRPWVETDHRVNYPCGLIARSVFNDSYVLVEKGGEQGGAWTPLDVDSSARTIAWASDTKGKFRNLDPEATAVDDKENQVHLNMWINRIFPPIRCVQRVFSEDQPWVPVHVRTRQETLPSPVAGESAAAVTAVDCRDYLNHGSEGGEPWPRCNFARRGESFECSGDYRVERVEDWGIESGHFIVWMRIAGLPNFRKTWGKVSRPLKAGTRLRVYFVDNFPVREHFGRKAFVMSTTSALGGRNDFLGYGYLAVGCACILFGGLFLWQHFVKPRPLGDISILAPQQ